MTALDDAATARPYRAAGVWRFTVPSTLAAALLSLLGSTTPGVRTSLDIGTAAIAVVFIGQTIGAIAGSAIVGVTRHALTNRRPMALLAAASLVAAGLAVTWWMLLICMTVVGFAAFVTQTRAQADMARQAGEARAYALGVFHVWGGAGAFAFPLTLAALLAIGVTWRAGYVLLAVAFAVYAVAVPPSRVRQASALKSIRGLPAGLRWVTLVPVLGLSVQVTVPLFLAALLVDEFGTSASAGTATISAYAFGLLVARVAGTRLLPRVGERLELRLGAALLIAGYAGLALAPGVGAVVVASVVIGFGVGQMLPLGMARVARVVDDDDVASSLVFTLASVAQLVLPGFVAVAQLLVGLRGAVCLTLGAVLVLAVAIRISEPAASRRRTAPSSPT
jgi:MFS family permease